jgi:copper ion binding protein
MRQGTVDLSVSGMSCASCVASLEAALGHVPGVADVNVNLATERATVAYDADATSVQTLAQAIEEVIRLAAAAEWGSEHPLGQAIVDKAQEDGISVVPGEDFEAFPGHGV